MDRISLHELISFLHELIAFLHELVSFLHELIIFLHELIHFLHELAEKRLSTIKIKPNMEASLIAPAGAGLKCFSPWRKAFHSIKVDGLPDGTRKVLDEKEKVLDENEIVPDEKLKLLVEK